MTEEKPGFSWGHININVRDLDRSIEFYRKFGFEVFIPAIPYLALEGGSTQTVPDDAAAALGITSGTRGRACIMQLDDGFPKIDLTEFQGVAQKAPLENADLGCVRICLISQDLSRDVAALQAKGVEFISAPKVGHKELANIAVCRDPDGTLIELLQVYLERWAPILAGE